MLKRFAEAEGGEVAPELPAFVWNDLMHLDKLSDFIGEAKEYKTYFETPLDDASEWLRNELARILGSKLERRPHPGTSRSNFAVNPDAPPKGGARVT
jgi:hypothetical protein